MPPAAPVPGDAFGEALRAYFEGRTHGAEIIERDDGFIDWDEIARCFAPPDQWSEVDRWALEGIEGRVLDVGAGAGRASLFLQERGCDVVALDVSPAATVVCGERGARAVFAGSLDEFAETDPAPFDAFVLLGNNLGLLRDAAYAPRFLGTLASIARPGAILAGTCLDPYRSGDPEHLAYHERNRAAGRMAGQVRIRIRYRQLATPWWDYLFMSLDELAHLVAGTRWRIEDQMDGGLIYAVRIRLK